MSGCRTVVLCALSFTLLTVSSGPALGTEMRARHAPMIQRPASAPRSTVVTGDNLNASVFDPHIASVLPNSAAVSLVIEARVNLGEYWSPLRRSSFYGPRAHIKLVPRNRTRDSKERPYD